MGLPAPETGWQSRRFTPDSTPRLGEPFPLEETWVIAGGLYHQRAAMVEIPAGEEDPGMKSLAPCPGITGGRRLKPREGAVSRRGSIPPLRRTGCPAGGPCHGARCGRKSVDWGERRCGLTAFRGVAGGPRSMGYCSDGSQPLVDRSGRLWLEPMWAWLGSTGRNGRFRSRVIEIRSLRRAGRLRLIANGNGDGIHRWTPREGISRFQNGAFGRGTPPSTRLRTDPMVRPGLYVP